MTGLTCPQAATYRGSVGVEPAVSCCAPCGTLSGSPTVCRTAPAADLSVDLSTIVISSNRSHSSEQADVPAEQPSPAQEARLPSSDAYPCGSRDHRRPPWQGSPAPRGLSDLLDGDHPVLPASNRLRRSDDFRRAVRSGRRAGRRAVVVHSVPAGRRGHGRARSRRIRGEQGGGQRGSAEPGPPPSACRDGRAAPRSAGRQPDRRPCPPVVRLGVVRRTGGGRRRRAAAGCWGHDADQSREERDHRFPEAVPDCSSARCTGRCAGSTRVVRRTPWRRSSATVRCAVAGWRREDSPAATRGTPAATTPFHPQMSTSAETRSPPTSPDRQPTAGPCSEVLE